MTKKIVEGLIAKERKAICEHIYTIWKTSKGEKNMRKEAAESNQNIAKGGRRSPGNHKHINVVEWRGGEKVTQKAPIDEDKSGDVNMDASITTDDVIQAGGFGARDDLNSFLPVASDSTDLEATILAALNYEEPREEICKYGIVWRESAEGK